MQSLKLWKNLYDKLGNDYLRSTALTAADVLGIKKDIIRLDTNCRCNIRCIMCNSKPYKSQTPYMEFRDYKKIIDLYSPTTRMLYLSCAFEPLITPDFPEYLKYAKTKGIPHVSFCTNGLLLNESLVKTLIEYGIDEMILSFNGFCKKDYHRIMPGSDFDKVCRNLKLLSDAKLKYHSEKPKIRMNTMLLKSNLSHMNDMYKMIQHFDIDLVQFRTLMLHEDLNNPDEVQNELPENQSFMEYKKMLNSIKSTANRLRRNGKKIILPDSVLNRQTPAFSMEAAAEFHPGQKAENIKKHCSVPFFSYWIDCEGNVKVCGYDEKGLIGNALTDSPVLMNQKKYHFRKQALRGKCANQNCTINVDKSRIL